MAPPSAWLVAITERGMGRCKSVMGKMPATSRAGTGAPRAVLTQRLYSASDRPAFDLRRAEEGRFAVVPGEGMIDALRRDYENMRGMIL